MNQDVIIIDILQDVVNAMKVPNISTINYQPGRNIQIIKSLADMDTSISYKGNKYPLVSVALPITEKRGLSVGYYAKAKIPRIVIATISSDPNDDVLARYADDGVFKTILYPCYDEFLNQLAQSKSIVGSDPNSFEHTKMDNPGRQPIGKGSNDFVDTIEILNLELLLNQIKTC